jgi:hypothetical protein
MSSRCACARNWANDTLHTSCSVQKLPSKVDSCCSGNSPFLWCPKVYQLAHKCPSLDHILSQFWLQFTSPHPPSLRSIVLLSHLRLSLASGFFPWECPAKILYAFLISYACYMFLPIVLLYSIILAILGTKNISYEAGYVIVLLQLSYIQIFVSLLFHFLSDAMIHFLPYMIYKSCLCRTVLTVERTNVSSVNKATYCFVLGESGNRQTHAK